MFCVGCILLSNNHETYSATLLESCSFMSSFSRSAWIKGQFGILAELGISSEKLFSYILEQKLMIYKISSKLQSCVHVTIHKLYQYYKGSVEPEPDSIFSNLQVVYTVQ